MFAADYLHESHRTATRYKRLADLAAAQVSDGAFFHQPSPSDNSIALIMKHMGGSMLSRFTGFLTTDGEKPTRDRDAEFERAPADTRASILALWEQGWAAFFAALAALTPADLARTVTIRREPHTVLQALERNSTHTAYHVGQIALLAKLHCGESWQSLSIPRGQSSLYKDKPPSTP